MNRFDMPTVFGPSLIPDQSAVAKARVIAISFETDADAAARLLPRHFQLADVPLVTVSRIDYEGVDYLGGRGYAEIVVAVAAVRQTDAGPVPGNCAVVLWVNEVGALVAGREYMGFPKLPGEIPAVESSADTMRFTCAEYGTSLLEGAVTQLTPLSAETLAKVSLRSQRVETFGHKYIPGPDGVADVDYPLVNVMRWQYAKAWSGQGALSFSRPSRLAAPLSSRAASVLAELPVTSWRKAFVGEGSALIDRTATRRI